MREREREERENERERREREYTIYIHIQNFMKGKLRNSADNTKKNYSMLSKDSNLMMVGCIHFLFVMLKF